MTAANLLAGYRPPPGVPDELVDGQGRMRPGWEGLIAHLGSLTPDEVRRDVARGTQHLADAGVFFRPYGDAQAAARDWPFAPVPIIIPEGEWDAIAAGLRQRADLLEMVVADLYGPNRLVAGGHLPARVVAESPEWLRPLVGVTPRGGRFLHFVAFEIGRGPDGRWWVLSDRADAPSGAGFALETRVAATRVFPDLHREAHVQRLAGFFRDFRDALELLRGDASARVGILTPGALTDTYYEQAYIARYLGLSLLEGGDLTVEGGRLKVRSVGGPLPVDVLWRRMDGAWADPLELREGSRLGAAGLVNAVRQGQVTMVNALGAGVLETQALMAFLPAICRRLLGEPLKLPNVATWWCGDADALAHVRACAGSMTVGPALATRMPFETGAPHAVAGEMRGGASRDVDDWLAEEGAGLVGKELVTLSTTPVWEDDRLQPRPMTIRAFLARTPDGWAVMPGGFGRVGRSPDPAAIAMREGGSAADVWVRSTGPVAPVTLLASAPARRAEGGALPTRAADNLYWLGRYVERTEGILRLLRASHARRADGAEAALLQMIAGHLDGLGVDAAEAVPQGMRDVLGAAVRAAGGIRDRFSVDGWAALSDLQKTMGRMAGTARPGADAALAASVLLRKIAGFAGLVHENMHRGTAWQFLSLGRSLERAAMMADLLAACAAPAAPQGALDLAVEVGDSVMTHRRRFALLASRETVLDLLALDEANPRALRFGAAEIADRLAALNGREGRLKGCEARAAALEAFLDGHTGGSLDAAALKGVHRDLFRLSDALAEAVLS